MSYTHIHKRIYHLGLFTKNLVETIVKYILQTTYVENLSELQTHIRTYVHLHTLRTYAHTHIYAHDNNNTRRAARVDDKIL